MKIYAAGPMSGLSVSEIKARYEKVVDDLRGYADVMHPMIDYLNFEAKTTDLNFVVEAKSLDKVQRSFFGRDKWMVRECDVLLADFSKHSGRISIGTIMEIAWAHLLGKYVITILPPNDSHDHAFLDQATDTMFDNYDKAIAYIKKLAQAQF